MSQISADQLLSQAISFQQQGRLEEAERLYKRLLAIEPQNPATLHFLGLTLHQRGQRDVGHQYMQRALDLSPNSPVFLSNLIHALIIERNLRKTIPLFQRLLELDPNDVATWHEFGLILSELGGEEEALECWRRALATDPRYQPASISLGAALRNMAFRDQAEVVYREALKHAPDDPELTCALAELLIETGHADKSLELLNARDWKNPDLPNVLYFRSVAHISRGCFDEAEASLRQLVSLEPDHYRAYVQLAGITRLPVADPAYQRLERIAHDNQQETPEQQINIHFSLGKILQDNCEYDHAFEHFSAGNRICRTIRPYSHAESARQADEIKRRINRDFIEQARLTGGNTTSLPIFIIGMPRSGTTLTEQILARHPSVVAGGEMVLLHSILRRLLGRRVKTDFAAALTSIDQNEFVYIARQMASGLQRAAGTAVHITDKMPSNFLIAGWLHALLPNARIIHCRRDPLDTCVSCYTTLFNYHHEFSNDLEDLGRYYRLYHDLMAHWRGLLPANRLFELDYESLVSDPESVVRGLLEFLELPWDRACLDFGKTSTTVHTASVRQVRQALYSSSVGRWKQYARHLAPLREALAAAD